jgi:hypothetical protein
MSMFQAGTQVSLVLVLLADDGHLYIVMCEFVKLQMAK